MIYFNKISNNTMEFQDAINLNFNQDKNRKFSLKQDLVLKELDSIHLEGHTDHLISRFCRVSGAREVQEVLLAKNYLNSLHYLLDQIQKIMGRIENSSLDSSIKNNAINELSSYKLTLTKLPNLYSSGEFKEIILEGIGEELAIRIPVFLYKKTNNISISIDSIKNNIENFLKKDDPISNESEMINLDYKSLDMLTENIITSYKDVKLESVIDLLK